MKVIRVLKPTNLYLSPNDGAFVINPYGLVLVDIKFGLYDDTVTNIKIYNLNVREHQSFVLDLDGNKYTIWHNKKGCVSNRLILPRGIIFAQFQ
jgi:hypothetical protein